ncbi:MAG TPA: O-GlcNAc transferase, partial [Phycisphaerae bacterium]|nr:O-GlcNAc transferase [Phycisphaerae bacterium]
MSSSRGRKRDRRRPAGLEPGADQSSPARGTKQKTARRAIWAAGLFLVGLTVLAYAPAIHNGYIWDDDYYVTENQTLRSFQGLGRIWCELGAVPQYYPLVHTSYWLEYRLWGLNPVGYHVVNILLHAVCALLAWRVLVLLEVPGAWVAAAVFALHPINVESAAWITERKNVLSGVFYMAAALAYLRYALVPGPAADRRARVRWYVAALAFFIFALFGKTVTGSLPAAILLVLWWKAGRVRPRDVWPLAPFFVAALAMGSLTAWMERQHVGAIGHEWDFSWLDRCLIAGRSLWFYVGKLVWPVDLTFIYPRWRIDASVWWQYLYPAAALAVIVGL